MIPAATPAATPPPPACAAGVNETNEPAIVATARNAATVFFMLWLSWRWRFLPAPNFGELSTPWSELAVALEKRKNSQSKVNALKRCCEKAVFFRLLDKQRPGNT